MKILVVCQYYHPEPFRITDICKELVLQGHQVTVVTGIPNYPMGEIYDGYKDKSHRHEIINGVEVYRCYTHPRKTGAIHRLLNYYSFSLSSSKIVSHLDHDFDVVFINQLSPVMMAEAGIKYAQKYNVKSVLYCLDLWPESLIAGGIKKDSFIYKLFHAVSAKIYANVDKILITSKSFEDYLVKEFAIDKSTIDYLPQYAESIFADLDGCKYNRAYDDNQDINFVFAGNIGMAQSVKTIIEAAELLKENHRIKWHIVGDGAELENCKAKAMKYGLRSVTFYGRKPLEEMPKFYAMADAMIVTMIKDNVISMTLPGKIQTYMAAGKPIIGAIEGECQAVIEDSGCGFCGPAEDSGALAENIVKFTQADNKSEMAAKAEAYYIANFCKESFMKKLTESLK